MSGRAAAGEGIILVTGGAGYVGSTLSRHLLALGYRVRVIDALRYGGRGIVGLLNDPALELIHGDLRSASDIWRALEGDVAAVVHLAAIVGDVPCQKNPEESVATNFTATQQLAEAARAQGVPRFIFASTCSNYGVADTSIPADEERPLNPVSLYAETKIDSERVLLQMQDESFRPVIFRFATAYGLSGRTRFDLLVNSLTYEALTSRVLIVYAAQTWRPFIHVYDMARILEAALRLPQEQVGGQIFNAGSNAQNYTKQRVAEMVAKTVGDVQVSYVTDVDDRRSYRVDFGKMERVFGLQPRYGVEDGIREIVAAFSCGVLTRADYEANSLKDHRSGAVE